MKITIEIEEKRMADLLVSGMEFRNGIGLWGEIVKLKKPSKMIFRFDKEQVFKHLDYPMNPGGYVEIMEHDDGSRDGSRVLSGKKPAGKRHRLTRQALLRGLRVMAQKYPKHFADALTEDDDINTSDVFIQCALFGEVRYE
jgi:hypothetical protein